MLRSPLIVGKSDVCLWVTLVAERKLAMLGPKRWNLAISFSRLNEAAIAAEVADVGFEVM